MFHKKIVWAVSLSLIICLGLFYILFAYVPFNIEQERKIKIQKGMSVHHVLNYLAHEQVLNAFQAKQLLVWVKVLQKEGELKAGSYSLFGTMTLRQLMNKLVNGDVIERAITIIEGQTAEDFLVLLKKEPTIDKALLADATDQDILELLKAPVDYLEGLFFPDTYVYTDGTPDRVLLELAYKTMQHHLMAAWERRAEDLAVYTPYEALVLASLIEKEGKLKEEYSMISGVFHRRLKMNMRLQSDPTVKYKLADRTKPLTRADLKIDHPFNTYLYPNLPPAPIALPSLESIEAALHPDRTNTLYFVARGDGSHEFSETLEAHHHAIDKYQSAQEAEGESNE